MNQLAEPLHRIDVRQVPPPQRHALIFATFDGLGQGDQLELVNDHDPLPLRGQFERTRAGQFQWDYVDSGPALWRVRISRQAAGPAGDVSSACCGSCSCR